MNAKSVRYFAIAFIVAAVFIAIVPRALAAPVTFVSNTDLLLASPATTFTVIAGSVADALTVNATSVVVTLSNTTGGTFTLDSASYDLAIATSSGGGTVVNSCSNGLMTAVLSQTSGSAAYTFTPSGQACSTASAPIITGIAAGNISPTGAAITWTTNIAADSTVSYGLTSSYGATSTNAALVTSHSVTLSGLSSATIYHFEVTSSENGTSTTSGDNTFTTSPSVTVSVAAGGGVSYVPGAGTITTLTPPAVSSTAELEARLRSLLAILCDLAAQAREKKITLPQGLSALCPSSLYVFTRDLALWDKGNDVALLQAFLVSEASGPAAAALDRHGLTMTFGMLTYRALVEFQQRNNIVPASGYFGPKTRAYVNGLSK